MALALYRKYRPATFADVVGQEHVTGPLMTAVDSGRINHAYLFSGPRGCGKTSSARILARSLNCEQGPTSTPCGTCQSCMDLAPAGSGNIDVIEIDAASHGGVDDARELRERAFQLPVHSRYKIYIIDEAHMVSNQGFNALLKVVEEPPESVIFIFATTEPDKVLPTIRSRTHHYPFRLVPPAAMRDLLERNCASEGVTVGAAVLPLVVRAGGGSVRDSQSLLDQLIAGAGPDGITYEEALALLGVTDAALLDDMIEAIGVGDGATVFGTVNRLIDAGHDPRRFAADLLDRLRDLILMAAVPDAGQKGLIDAPVDHVERLADQAGRLGLSTLSRLADIVHVGLTEMRGTTAPRLGLELICARMLLPAVGDDAASMMQRIERLERRMEIGGLPAADVSSGGAVRRDGPGHGSRGEGLDRVGAAPGAGSSRAPRTSGGLTPRQRAEAEVAARRAAQQRPDDAGMQPSRAGAGGGQDSGGHAARPQPAGAQQRTPMPPPAAEPAARPDEPARSIGPRGPHTPAHHEDDAESGWPEVKAPGSGRGQSAAPASSAPAGDVASPKSAALADSAMVPDAAGMDPTTSHNAAREGVTVGSEPERAPNAEPTSVAGEPSGHQEARPAEPDEAGSALAERDEAGSALAEPEQVERAQPARPRAVEAVREPAVAGRPRVADATGDPVNPTQPQQASSDFDIAEVRRQWRAVVDLIKRSSRASAALVETATPVVVRGDTLVLAAPSALVRRLADPQQHQPLKAALQNVLGVSWAIEVTDNSGNPAGRAEEPARDEEDFAPDPYDEPVADPRAGLDPGQAAVNLLRDELGAEIIDQ